MSTMTAAPISSHLSAGPSSHHPGQTTPRSASRAHSPHASPNHSGPGTRNGSPRIGSSTGSDADSVLRAHGGDTRRALDALLSDKQSLQAQNSQLWKLIEKQRAQSATLVADCDRLRGERDRALSRLADAGLDVPGGSRRMPNSSSAMGLGVRSEPLAPPPIRRHNSDREDTRSEKSVEREKERVPAPRSASGVMPPASFLAAEPTVDLRPNTLLPSPMSDVKLRRESRITFPPEVTSFISLADSPKEASHSIPERQDLTTSDSATSMSPPSQYSTTPSSSVDAELNAPSVSITMSSLATTQEEEEPDDTQQTPVPPKFFVPIHGLPPRSSSVRSPTPPIQTAAFPEPHPASPIRPSVRSIPLTDSPRQSVESGTSTPRPSMDPRLSQDRRPSIEENRPGSERLPKLTLSLLPHTRISIPSSTIYPNQLGRDVLCFLVSITLRPPNAQPVSWIVGKLFSAFIDLDSRIKSKAGKGRKEWKSMVAPLPDGKSWKDFAPSKIDQRKSALEAYLQSLLVAPLSDKSDLCEFLCTDPLQAKINSARKEGYLTKKGKNFGGWKTRYFVLEGPTMEYYESRGGSHLGSILITNAQIGRQNRPSESSDDRELRHAFLVIEANKNTRHVLCAESDQERDSWIEVLVRHVDAQPAPVINAPPTRRRSVSVRKASKDVVVTAAQPLNLVSGSNTKFSGAPSPSLINSMESQKTLQAQLIASSSQASNRSVSSGSQTSLPSAITQEADGALAGSVTVQKSGQLPSNSIPVTLVTSATADLAAPSAAEPTSKSAKRHSVMPSKPQYSSAYLSKLSAEGLSAPPGMPPADKERDRKAKSGRFWPSFGKTPEKVSRPVFGVSVSESIAVASVANLPAIVFRCIEWLEAKHAEREEGIYRLSGSSAVIKGLKERFDAEGDVKLVAVDEHWDPHAIAGLLKTFLRDLPQSLLTRELHSRFLAVMDLVESSARVHELSRLVSELPPPNYALLRALTAHLILIVKNSQANKMTLRNIGIVFSPTLGIPAGIFSELVSHFGEIFDDEPSSFDEGEAESIISGQDEPEAHGEETLKRNRNSVLYQAGGADALLGLGGRALDPATEDEESESEHDTESEAPSLPSGPSSENLASPVPSTPRAQYPSAAEVRRAKAAARAQERGLTVEASSVGSSSPKGSAGLPASPRPSARLASPGNMI